MSLPPIRREVVVSTDPENAFRVFTEEIGRWWPVAAHSVHGAGASVSFEDGVIVERAGGGERAVWGQVRRWEPGRLLSFTWHPGSASESASEVTVTFSADGRQTRVLLEHGGWEVFADPSSARDEYDHGWPAVLDSYRDQVQLDSVASSTWVALMHTPGPTAPTDGSLYSDPRFVEHVDFLQRMEHRGYLVAAGPLTDAEGSGMTILRLPGEGREAEAVELATKDDFAVASGLLAVTVRPWNVMFHTLS
jgi:uncharacterized protein YndB with AHSA1/START domain/uncharacterized protein YciI